MSNEVFDLVKKASIKTKFLNAEEEKDLIEASKKGDTKATETLFNANSRYILKEAVKYSNDYGLPLEDCFSACVEGFIKSIEKFDCKQTTRLITLSSYWFRSMCQEELYKSHAIKIPHNKLGFLKEEYRYNNQDSKMVALLNAAGEIVSLDAPLDDEDDAENLYDSLSSSITRSEIEYEMTECKKTIESVMKENLNDREIYVLKMAFGYDGETHSLSEIGKLLGCSKQRADQIKNAALLKLRQPRVFYQLKDLVA